MTAWTVVSGVAVVATLVFVAWQARETAHYARITSDGVASATARNSLTHLQLVLKEWLERPELRSYFDERRPWPSDPAAVSRLRTIVEMWADCVAASLDFDSVEGFEGHGSSWAAYAMAVLEISIVAYDVVAEHPEWWPTLAAIVSGIPAPNASLNVVESPLDDVDP